MLHATLRAQHVLVESTAGGSPTAGLSPPWLLHSSTAQRAGEPGANNEAPLDR